MSVRRKSLLLLSGIILFSISIVLVIYGSTLPNDLVLHSKYSYSHTYESNVPFLVGFALLPIAWGFLGFWIFTRRKNKKSQNMLNDLAK